MPEPAVVAVRPEAWPENIRVFTSTRYPGASPPPYAGFNLATHVGDSLFAVTENRRRLRDELPPATRVAWLSQVHGRHVVHAQDALQAAPEADACWTALSGLACAVMSADCLPVLLTDTGGTVVAAAHAGWRGLAAGVLEATLEALPVPPSSLMAWLGPAIGPTAFEVGPEVRDAFVTGADDAADAASSRCFSLSKNRRGHFFADLHGLARHRLEQLGVAHITSDESCTYSDARRFYSHRRDGCTGRMASLILRLDASGPLEIGAKTPT